jgi:hypothetical protein
MTDIERLRDILAKIESYGDYSTRGARLSECYVAAYTFLRDRGHALLADMERRATAPDDAESALQFLKDAASASTTESDAESAVATIRRHLANCERLRGMEADAKRYRWIRMRASSGPTSFEVVEDAAWTSYYGLLHNFDMNIDEAMALEAALVPVPGGEGK